MLLYYAPGSCSLAPHIVLREACLPFDVIRVSLATKKTTSGEDFAAVNEKAYVPALELADGDLLTEVAAIVQYVADLAPETGLAPANGTMDRYRLQELLHFIGTELHKSWSQLFGTKTPNAYRAVIRERLAQRLGIVARRLRDRPYLLGETFTVADAYLFSILRFSNSITGVDLTPYPAIVAYVDRIARRPAVRAALEAEGLVRRQGASVAEPNWRESQ